MNLLERLITFSWHLQTQHTTIKKLGHLPFIKKILLHHHKMQYVQNAIPHLGFYAIRVHDLAGSFSPVPEGHTETVAGVL